jgi:hypothetical protein
MNDENPYAPSLAGEPQAPPSRVWRLDGISLLVKNQAVLPMVDLNTGEQGGDMKCVRRSLLKRNPVTMAGTLLLVAAYFILSRNPTVDPMLLMVGLIVALFLIKQMEALRASPTQRLHEMAHQDLSCEHPVVFRLGLPSNRPASPGPRRCCRDRQHGLGHS